MKRWLYFKIVKIALLLIFFSPIVAYAFDNMRLISLGFLGSLLIVVAEKKFKENVSTDGDI